MGLLIDQKGIPLSYGLFPGNESEKVNMLPIINRAKHRFGFNRTIVVADRGLNTSDNIFYLNGNNKNENNPRDGYIYGQSIRGADEEFKKWCIDSAGYQVDKVQDGNQTVYFKHKSRIYPRTIYVNVDKDTDKPRKMTITVDQKQMVYFSQKYADKQALERNRAVQRAKDLIAHPKKYDKVSAKGASGYVKNIAFNKKTGEK
jgi:transposase